MQPDDLRLEAQEEVVKAFKKHVIWKDMKAYFAYECESTKNELSRCNPGNGVDVNIFQFKVVALQEEVSLWEELEHLLEDMYKPDLEDDEND